MNQKAIIFTLAATMFMTGCSNGDPNQYIGPTEESSTFVATADVDLVLSLSYLEANEQFKLRVFPESTSESGTTNSLSLQGGDHLSLLNATLGTEVEMSRVNADQHQFHNITSLEPIPVDLVLSFNRSSYSSAINTQIKLDGKFQTQAPMSGDNFSRTDMIDFRWGNIDRIGNQIDGVYIDKILYYHNCSGNRRSGTISIPASANSGAPNNSIALAAEEFLTGVEPNDIPCAIVVALSSGTSSDSEFPDSTFVTGYVPPVVFDPSLSNLSSTRFNVLGKNVSITIN